MKKLELAFVCQELCLDEHILIEWLEAELIIPVDSSGPFFDEEDVSRISLLCELRTICDANTSSLEVIMHLLDQIHLLQKEIKDLDTKASEV